MSSINTLPQLVVITESDSVPQCAAIFGSWVFGVSHSILPYVVIPEAASRESRITDASQKNFHSLCRHPKSLSIGTHLEPTNTTLRIEARSLTINRLCLKRSPRHTPQNPRKRRGEKGCAYIFIYGYLLSTINFTRDRDTSETSSEQIIHTIDNDGPAAGNTMISTRLDAQAPRCRRRRRHHPTNRIINLLPHPGGRTADGYSVYE